jgi:hypothetical protein
MVDEATAQVFRIEQCCPRCLRPLHFPISECEGLRGLTDEQMDEYKHTGQVEGLADE